MTEREQELEEEIQNLKELRRHDKQIKLKLAADMLKTLNRGDIQNLKETNPELMDFFRRVLNE